MSEEFRAIPGYEGRYQVSDRGRIRRDPASRGRGGKPGHVLSMNHNGPEHSHQWVTLYRNGVGRCMYVHRAVALAFLPGEVAPVVRHLDDDPTNNVPANLAWGTQADNVHDMIRAGRARNGRRNITHCPRGHIYDESNTHVSKRGSRSCRACARDRARAAYRRATNQKAA